MDFTDSKSGWIWAVKSGSALSSNSVSADINQHNNQGEFQLDLTKARGGDSLNPFKVAAATNTGAGGASPTSASSSSGSGAGGDQSSGGSSGDSSSGSSDGGSSGGDQQKRDRAVIAHGTTMSLAFVLFFPIGAIIIRLFNFRGLVWVHVATQISAYMVALAGLGLGVYIAVTPSSEKLVSSPLVPSNKISS